MKIQQPSINKKQGFGEDHVSNFQKRAGSCEKIKHCIDFHQKPDDNSCLDDKKQNASKVCSKYNIRKRSVVQKSVNTSPKKEKQNSSPKLKLKDIFSMKTQLATKSLSIIEKVSKTKKFENSPMSVKSSRKPVVYVLSDRLIALSRPRIRGGYNNNALNTTRTKIVNRGF